MTKDAAVAAVLAAARSLLFVREEPKNSNRGQAIEAMLKLTGLGPGHPWCAADVAWIGRAALGEKWPMPLTASCWQLGESAKAKGILMVTPEPGDVFLMHYPSLNRFAHTGFVVARDGKKWATIEGNTGATGEREGWGHLEKVRTFGPNDRFIRWTAAL